MYLKQESFIQTAENLINSLNCNRKDEINGPHYIRTISAWYNQLQDIYDNSELAEKNFHHDRKTLETYIIVHAIHLELLFKRFNIDFDTSEFIDAST